MMTIDCIMIVLFYAGLLYCFLDSVTGCSGRADATVYEEHATPLYSPDSRNTTDVSILNNGHRINIAVAMVIISRSTL